MKRQNIQRLNKIQPSKSQIEPPKQLWLSLSEHTLLAAVLSIAVLRATFTETPHTESIGPLTPLSNEALSLLLSAALLGGVVVWWVLSSLAGRRPWRRTYYTAAIGAFCIFGLTGAFFASDKRAALTDMAVMMSGPAAGLLAIQLFDRKEKVRLFLWLLLAVGAAATYACYDKLTASNAQLISEYEKNPAAFLATLGIEPGSLQQWQYEHRLYSQDVAGFLTTSNSAGSFFLLAVFAGLGLCIEAFRVRGKGETLAAMICATLATAVSLAGLMMTQSKGAIASFCLFAAILAACVIFRKRIWKARIVLCVILSVLVTAAVIAALLYGLKHDRLPGGNSMLVRWQYWVASTQMAQEHPLLGVGGGNFAPTYLRYKNPAAPETISDPHNWVFSMLCRFGVAGLAALGWAILRPTGRLFSAALDPAQTPPVLHPGWQERFFWLTLLASVMVVMMGLRPGVLGLAAQSPNPHEYSAAFLILIVIPAGIIALVFGLLRFSGTGDASLNRPNTALMAAIACGLSAVLLHNLVDFALFEPGVWTMFWLLMAAGVALIEPTTQDHSVNTVPATPSLWRPALWLLPAAAYALFVLFVVIPPVRRSIFLYRAIYGPATETETLLKQTLAADTFSPNAAVTAAHLMMQRYNQFAANKNPALLDKAIAFAETAIARTPADPRPRQLKGEILMTAAQQRQTDAEKQLYLEKAYQTFKEALQHYPGLDRLNYRLGVLAEELNRPEEAMVYLEAALEIEQQYREQFRIMYPDQKEVISRLGPKVYADVLERLNRLR